ncbi:MAG: MG2 domain-containing protein [Saprospiraceae bacterium]
MKKLLAQVLLLLLVFTSCSKQRANKQQTHFESYREYINAYPTGYLKASEPVNLHFEQKAIDSSLIGSEVSSKIFQIQPQLSGKAVWKNEYTISFTADQSKLDRKITYTAKTQLNEIFKNVPDSLNSFAFEFNYVPISINLTWDYLHTDQEYEGAMLLEGKLKASDEIPEDQMKNLIKTEASTGNSPVVTFTKLESSENEYRVGIHHISRSDDDGNLKLEWLTDPSNSSSKIEMTYSIPAKGKFIVTGAKEDDNDSKSMLVFFSDLLDNKQDLKGLIQVSNDSIKSTLILDRDIVHVSFNTELYRQGSLFVSDKIKNVNGKYLSSSFRHIFNLKEEAPKVRLLSSGKIIPFSDKIIFPFEAINLNKIDVEIFKIFSNNVLYNMHLNTYDDEETLTKLGRVVHQQTIELSKLNEMDNRTKWVSYGLDLSQMIQSEPGAMYEVRLIFRPQYSDYRCNGEKLITVKPTSNYSNRTDEFISLWTGYGMQETEDSENDAPCYEYENPCCLAYYGSSNFVRKTILASNLAMMVKSTNDQSETTVMVYDVNTASPVSGSELNFYDNQLQIVGSGKTDNNGLFHLNSTGIPKFVTANYNKNSAYLKIDEAQSITTSEFDIDGAYSKQGLKASVYTERGIWRPGDTILLNTIISQDSKELPSDFPLSIELHNPKNQLVFQQKLVQNVMGLYSLKIPTLISAITGIYRATITCGPLVVEKNLPIETIKPNRFKIDWSFQEKSANTDYSGTIQANFLHGAPAADKKITIEVSYSEVPVNFSKYSKYSFADPFKHSANDLIQLEDAKTNTNGSLKVDLSKITDIQSNGVLKCNLITKIMDEGGDLSTDYLSKEFYSNDEYLGIRMPETDFPNYYPTQELQGISIVSLDQKGNPLSNRKVKVELFETSWEWWYEVRNHNTYYTDNHILSPLDTKNVTTDAKGIASINFNVSKYHQYYIKVSNNNSYQTAGQLFYTGWSEGNDKSKEFVQILNIGTDKEKYNIGEKATISLPGAASGTYIIHIIRNNKIIKTETIKPKLPKTEYSLSISPEMFPNVYVDVNLIQGLKNKVNDLPLRLYGVVPLLVEEENLHLKPVIKMDDKVRPNEEFSVEISESKSNMMTYQLLIVDDGLLSLTRFQTPDPYKDMFQKEALTLLSWDNYDQFIGSDVASLHRIFSIGGDQKISAEDLAKMQRFKPVVLSTGPQTIKKGEKRIHKFKIENYIGSVRVMVVANNLKAFGSTDKTVIVRDELASQITFPRVASIADKISVPVTVFKYEASINSAEVQLKVSGPAEIIGKSTQTISFGSLNEKTIFFDLRPNGTIGSAKLECKAQSGNYSSNSSLDIYLDNPNPFSNQITTIQLEPGKSIVQNISDYGMPGTESMRLEVSKIENLKSEKYLQDLLRYPHGCVEQTTSAAFPQLYLAEFVQLSEADKLHRINHITTAIAKLANFQNSDGGMSYWPGMRNVDEYCTNYVCHFLAEAKNKGFQLSSDFLSKLIKYQISSSSSFSSTASSKDAYADFFQAYRLYSLSALQSPEWGAMNRLRLAKTENSMSRWLLAGAYALAGKKEIANELVKEAKSLTRNPNQYYYSYGSDIRDDAFIAMVLNDCGDKNAAREAILTVVKNLNADPYPNTQELSVTMSAIGKIFGNKNMTNSKMQFSYSWDGKEEQISTDYAVFQTNINGSKDKQMKLKNNSDLPITIQIIQTGKIAPEMIVNKSNNLNMRIDYYLSNGKLADLNKLKQGDELTARINISNTALLGRLNNLALTAVFPSGFEIVNRRIGGIDNSISGVDYMDFRDDRVYYYFGLNKGQHLQIEIPLVAAYIGSFMAPLFKCEAMYEPSVNAQYRNGSISIKPL